MFLVEKAFPNWLTVDQYPCRWNYHDILWVQVLTGVFVDGGYGASLSFLLYVWRVLCALDLKWFSRVRFHPGPPPGEYIGGGFMWELGSDDTPIQDDNRLYDVNVQYIVDVIVKKYVEILTVLPVLKCPWSLLKMQKTLMWLFFIVFITPFMQIIDWCIKVRYEQRHVSDGVSDDCTPQSSLLSNFE